MTDFHHFGLSEEVLRGIEELGFSTATPIQKKAIPSLLNQKRDFIGLAHTGTGKTAAFALPLIDNILLDNRYIQGIIIAPTRELVKQIHHQISLISKYKKGLKVEVVYGGVSISAQISALRKPPHILIATPGRLLDLMRRKVIVLKDVQYVVLDEADEMLNMGFKEDIDDILSGIDGSFTTWLFSATFPREIRRISSKYMTDPLEFAVDSVKESNASIKHEYCIVKGARKTEFLKRLLDSQSELRGIIFCRTKRGTQSLSDELQEASYKVDALHGDMSQAQRERVMKKFRNYQIQVLIATDVAARGIDVSDLSHIIHYDIPDGVSYYTHRSGRTGRAGKTGTSVVFVPPSQERKLKHMERLLKIKFVKARIPNDNEVIRLRMNKWAMDITQSKEIFKIDPDIFTDVYGVFNNFTKDELIEKLVFDKLKGFNYSGKKPQREREEKQKERKTVVSGERSRDRDRGRDRRREKMKPAAIEKSRGKRREVQEKSHATDELVNFFINVGYVDGVGKRDLLTYIAEQSGLQMQDLENLEMGQKHSFFDASGKFEGKIISSFKNIKIGNRQLRVNRNQR